MFAWPLLAEETDVAAPQTPKDVAVKVDQLFLDVWQAEGIVAAERAGDEEFVRRVYLDLAGRIPAVSEVRVFLESDAETRRNQVLEDLLQDPAYIRHMTIVWRNALIPQAMTQVEFRGLIPGFDAWLWERLASNIPYDELVREIISSDVMSRGDNLQPLSNGTSPDAFFVVRGLRPENLAAGTARAFLGIRLDCAQCHDHPFDRWKQEQFWNMAAFYAGLTGDEDGSGAILPAEQMDRRSIRIPDTNDVVPAIFLTGESVEELKNVSPREQLADWVTSDKNPWFAQMAVNRLWAQFFGRGLVSPTDDFSDSNPPAHPLVLRLLSEQLIAHDFDLTFVIRTIVATDVYQLSSRQTHVSQQDPALFARAAVRGLTPEQFFDSLAEAVGFYQPYRSENPFVINTESTRARFIEFFRDEAESALDQRSTILQALAMMNGDFVGDATHLQDSRTLRAVIEFPLMSDEERLEALFMAALSRRPSQAEQAALLPHIREAEESSAALADVFWAVLNSSEFLLNH